MRRSNVRPSEVGPVHAPETSCAMIAFKPHQLRPPSSSSRFSILPKHRRPRRRAALFGSALAAVLLCLFVVSRGLNRPKYSIVVDGGSTGSRIHVFAYRSGWGSLPALDTGLSASMKVSPGLSSYSSNPDTAGKSLAELLEFAKVKVPPEVWEDTEVRLMATAGLRLLDASVVNRILESCRKVLRSSAFRFQDDWASVISGSDEGIYAWVAANYALGTLGADPKITTGIFELGGASAQITFVSSVPLVSEFSHLLTIGKITYNLYSHSFLNLGQNVAYDMLHELLSSSDLNSSADFSQEAIYVDPCTPRGYVHEIESQTFSSGLIHAKSKFRSSHANGNFSKCRMTALKLLAKENEKCLDQYCRLGLKFIPILEGRFFATENFFYTSKFFGLGETSSLSDLISAGEKYCSEDWSQIINEYNTYQKEDLSKFCFSSAYILALLNDTLEIDLDDRRIVFAKQVGNVPLDWALGAFIVRQALQQKIETSDRITAVVRNESSPWLSTIVASILLTFAAWFLLRCMRPKLKIIYDLERGRYILTLVKQ
ncbi:probable apyrase 6 [Zingiber officinale]|uniref:probable apyrase 6 n=1 Tax=Zingiber officinale TaxID=94328 RepID=UPI001C4CF33B|nr:probable apyrase 6 [Zingiber officinale]